MRCWRPPPVSQASHRCGTANRAEGEGESQEQRAERCCAPEQQHLQTWAERCWAEPEQLPGQLGSYAPLIATAETRTKGPGNRLKF